MPDPLVSVIIGTYNREQYIRETLDSVFAQTFTDYEIIVVDDASTDGTLDILETYGDRIRLIRRAENSGTADRPRYQAVQAARGKYCALLDSDDVWRPCKLERQVAFMEAHPDVALCHSYVQVMDGKGNLHEIRHEGQLPETGMIAAALCRHCFICTSSVMVKPDLWLAAQREADLTEFGTEWDFFLSIARAYPVGLIPEVLVHYRRSEAGVSHERNWKRYPRDVGAKKRLYRKRLWEGVIPVSEMKKIITEACWENAVHHRERGYPGRALYFCREGLILYPPSIPLYLETAKALLQHIFNSHKKRKNPRKGGGRGGIQGHQ